MESAKVEKLKDYFSGLRELKNLPFFPIGIIIVDERERNEARDIVKAEQIPMFTIDRNDNTFHPDVVLEGVISVLQNKHGVALDVRNALPPKIFNQLANLSHNRIYVQLAGKAEPVNMNPVPAGGFVVLLMNDAQYRDLVLGDTASSFCNLAR